MKLQVPSAACLIRVGNSCPSFDASSYIPMASRRVDIVSQFALTAAIASITSTLSMPMISLKRVCQANGPFACAAWALQMKLPQPVAQRTSQLDSREPAQVQHCAFGVMMHIQLILSSCYVSNRKPFRRRLLVAGRAQRLFNV
jgi:hypothetical protein